MYSSDDDEDEGEKNGLFEEVNFRSFVTETKLGLHEFLYIQVMYVDMYVYIYISVCVCFDICIYYSPLSSILVNYIYITK